MSPLRRFLKVLKSFKANRNEEAKAKGKTPDTCRDWGLGVRHAPENMPTVARKPLPVPARKPLPAVAHPHPDAKRHRARPPVLYRSSMGYFPLEQEEHYVPPSLTHSTDGTGERKMKNHHPRQQRQSALPGLSHSQNPPGYLGGTPYKHRAAQPKKAPPLERQKTTPVRCGAIRGRPENRLRQ